ncbi:flavin reductase (DIM6/NTAB) family NADH-FMN oxidoreductase RutF [Sphingobium sp. B7D2B]|uniref:flavin reductase family protein n=1 Tax=Sphingobium sp. B7D2B TaxID=2940583 RepID=UPI00222549A4|nr:flavin reductase family protein [Sphingobium sp. B7D2B]MCW2365372.1 flavin reductase (DIM6/NTAB) family NADH-FMN oxidoreductase RutF [Sphingobium sp. B7D2B]
MTELSPVAISLREGLRRLAKAVVVITCRHNGIRYAMAATAVSELSMDPPSLLICVNRSASLYLPLSEGADFCVNILHSDHADISAACAGKARGEERFATGKWGTAADGCPRLEDAQASFFCRYEQALDYGTHHIVIGRVEDVFLTDEVSPLVYANGSYVSLGAPITAG